MKHNSVNKDISDNNKYKNPLISVVIPVYNVEKYLCECLDSVINQTYSFLEIIIIDDGSTDSSGTICDNYMVADSRIRVVHQHNYGLGHARNVGMKEATGKYIIFLDSDDYWQLNTLEELLKEAEAHDVQVVVFSAQPFIDGVEEFEGLDYGHSVQNNVVKTGLDSLSCAVSHGEYYSQACLRLYRFDYLIKNDFKFDEGIIHEDESFSFLAYINAERIECLGERYYKRRYRPGSIMMSRDFFLSAHGYRVAIDTLLKYMQKKPMCRMENKLFNKQIIGYIFTIFSLYKKTKRMASNDNLTGNQPHANDIIADTQDTIRQVCRKAKGFPLSYRLIMRNFKTGYCFWLLHEMLKKIVVVRK